MKKLFALLLVSAMLLSGCGYTEDDLAAEWEAGYDKGKSDAAAGYSKGYAEGYEAGYSKALEDFNINGNEEYCTEYTEDPAVTQPDPEPESTTESSGQSEITVYVTDTGTKYHHSGCGSLWNSSHERTLSQAISQGYGPCGNCNPPTQ